MMIFTYDNFDFYKKAYPLFNLVIIVFTIALLISIRTVTELSKKELEYRMSLENLKQVEELLTMQRTQKHDYINHIQTIQSLIYTGKIPQATDYIQGLTTQYHDTNKVFRMNVPALTALLNIKLELALQYDISIDVDYDKLAPQWFKAWDLCSIVGNLLDNAIFHYTENDVKSESIKLTIKHDHEYLSIFTLNKFFWNKALEPQRFIEQGYTSLDDTSRGLGLYIVNSIAKKYKGEVIIIPNKEEIEIGVRLKIDKQ